jgi:glycosyltransferase involved in cell wall biosynthesis
MKLLIVTQVLDKHHPILGFFHRWVEEFAKHCEKVTVICLQKGEYTLPANVSVYSLGKEVRKSKLEYLTTFYKLIWQLRHEYDSVFVHMNQIYVILGAPLWRAQRKNVGLWYAHGSVTPSLKLAEKMTNVVITCTPESFRVKSNKVVITGHGIDTNHFSIRAAEKTYDLVTVGRITEAKNLATLIDIFSQVRKSHDVTLTLVGSAVTSEDKKYETTLKQYITDSNLIDRVNFIGNVSQTALPSYLNKSKIFVTTAKNGSLDKAMLEAMACGLPIVSMAEGSRSLPLGAAQVKDITDFVAEVKKVLESQEYANKQYSDFVAQNHSLQSLVPKILATLS